MKPFKSLRSVIETVLVILKHQSKLVEESSATGLDFDSIYSFLPFELLFGDSPNDRVVECSNSRGNSRLSGGEYTNGKRLFQHCATITINYNNVKYVLKIFHHKIHICGVQNDGQIEQLLDFFIDNLIYIQNLSTDLSLTIFKPEYVHDLDLALRQWSQDEEISVPYRHLQLLLSESDISELRIRSMAYHFAVEYHHGRQDGKEFQRLHKQRYVITPEGVKYFERIESKVDRKISTELESYKIELINQSKHCFGEDVYQVLSDGLTDDEINEFFEPITFYDVMLLDHQQYGVVVEKRLDWRLHQLVVGNDCDKSDSVPADELYSRAEEYFGRLRRSFPNNDNRFAAIMTGVQIYPEDLVLDRIVPLMINYRFYLDQQISTREIIQRLKRAKIMVYYNNTATHCIRVFVPYQNYDENVYIKPGPKSLQCTVFNIYPGHGNRDLIPPPDSRGPYIMQSSPNRMEAEYAYNLVVKALTTNC